MRPQSYLCVWHSMPTVIGGRYDALCYFDDTQALYPLHGETTHPLAELEAYPWSDNPSPVPRPPSSSCPHY